MYQIMLLIAKCLLASRWLKSNSQYPPVGHNQTSSQNSTVNNEMRKEDMIMSYATVNLNHSDVNCSKINLENKFNSTNRRETGRPPWRLDDPKDDVFWSQLLKDVEVPVVTNGRRSRESYHNVSTYAVVFPTRLESGQPSVCSGTLVDIQWVLTAAHCVTYTTVPGKVYVGAYFNVLSPEPYAALPRNVQEGQTVAIYRHPDYDPKNTNNDHDLALIMVQGFHYTRFVKPVKLWLEPWASYSNCSITDFGQQGEYSRANSYGRKTLSMTVMKPCRCYTALMRLSGRAAVDRLICTQSAYFQEFARCPGGSGAGLVCDGQVRGVASYAVVYNDEARGHCDIRYATDHYSHLANTSCASNRSTSVFQDIYPSLNWLNKHLKLYKLDDDDNMEEKNVRRRGSSSKVKHNCGLIILTATILVGLPFHIV